MNIRKIIANRLYYELDRRDIPLSDIAKKTNLKVQKIEKYLNGSIEIKIADIMAICQSVGVNAVRLLYSQQYPKSKLSFRMLILIFNILHRK